MGRSSTAATGVSIKATNDAEGIANGSGAIIFTSSGFAGILLEQKSNRTARWGFQFWLLL